MSKTPTNSDTTVLDDQPDTKTFMDDVLTGLGAERRNLPCKYFYDERGSQLFDEICDLDEYYLTRTELDIMTRFAPEMAEQVGEGVMLVEYGSGSSIKTRLLLDELIDPVAYVPVDISLEHLRKSAQKLSNAYPELEVLPVCADFTEDFQFPIPERTPTHAAVYFPGSTIGNFQPKAAKSMLSRIAPLCGTGGGLLIGIDLQKDVSTIEAAYNDAKGVTAQFNLNLLTRINNELGADFELQQFEHAANYDAEHGRVEIGLRSCKEQVVTVDGRRFRFDEGEEIRTEYSHKYTIQGFAKIASEVGLELHRSWTDPDEMFGVLHLAVAD